MPNLKNAKKALKQSIVHADRNKIVKANIDSMRRQFRKLLESAKLDEAKKLVHDLGKALDKAVTKHVVKPNTAARIKSRTAIRLAKSAK
ncbi:MAG: 30S ribosomal protein S20 [Candidatus Uhrbacteria bacterium]|nr:30S ribosomal protein S20 [Candidatus Uhrbacteria bacterium]